MDAQESAPLSGARRFPARGPVLWIVATVVLALLTLGLGYAIGRGKGKAGPGAPAAAAEKKIKFWTCSMHPQIKQPGPGQCPLCGMTLVPVYEGGGDEGGPRRLVMSEAGKALAEIEVARVERKFVQADIRLVGKVDYDETRVKHITAWFPGRLDRLFVDYTGIPVRKGDHLAEVYSPELLSAQEELIQAKRAFEKAAKGSSEFMRRSSKATLAAAREKLRLWGLTPEQVENVERSGAASDRMTIHSPMAGIVIKKHLGEGAYVKTGTRIYMIADLSRVWIKLDAYESDLEWIRYGQDVEFRSEAYPGEVFRGTISFIDPVLDARTRTVKLRVIAGNADGRLKPGMFVHARVRPTIALGGRVMDPRLAGKWIGPMHPEVVKDGPGACDVCGMPLVRAEELGYVAAEAENAPLVIPASAPLLTGKRAVVYVKVPDKKRPTYEGREVVLGPRAGDYYIVRAGLAEGDEVVARGAFKIDSALQIEAKPSMMSPTRASGTGARGEGGPKPKPREVKPLKAPDAFRSQLEAVLGTYLELKKALASDDARTATAAAAKLKEKLDAVDMKLLKGDAHMAWMRDAEAIGGSAAGVAAAADITKQREGFALLSESVAAAIRRFGPVGRDRLFLLKCPMAFNNRGARWLQDVEAVGNPYLGAAMFKCGEVVETLNEKKLRDVGVEPERSPEDKR